MLIAECLWYAGVTVFLSVGIGGILGWIFDYVISSFNIFGELSYQFPLMETVVFVLGTFGRDRNLLCGCCPLL